MTTLNNTKVVEWILRIAIAGEFVGHGALALQTKKGFIPLITGWGFSQDFAIAVLPIIGAIDLLLAISVIIKPMRGVLLWMTLWGFLTALARPIAGEPIWDFVERWANWGAPLALLLLIGWPKTVKDLFK
ncbi:MAG: hypothetical protein N2Z68_02625 [Patescibacteria group bacterium]|nr:hypothetical protein [Patescibacteria group bacterium]